MLLSSCNVRTELFRTGGVMLAKTTKAACVLLAVVALTGCSDGAGPRPSPAISASATATPLPRLDASRAQQFSADMGSGDLLRLRHSVEIPPGARLGAPAVAQLKALGQVTFDLTTYTQTGDDTASVGGSSKKERWKVHLVRVGGQWMIAATERTK